MCSLTRHTCWDRGDGVHRSELICIFKSLMLFNEKQEGVEGQRNKIHRKGGMFSAGRSIESDHYKGVMNSCLITWAQCHWKTPDWQSEWVNEWVSDQPFLR